MKAIKNKGKVLYQCKAKCVNPCVDSLPHVPDVYCKVKCKDGVTCKPIKERIK